jgi:integrase
VADLVRKGNGALVALPLAQELIEEAARNSRRSLAAASRRAYAADWRRFEGWCDAYGVIALPATEATIVTYLTAAARGYELEGYLWPPLGYGSLARLYSAIRVYHSEAEAELPRQRGVMNTLRTIGRQLGTAPKSPKKGLTTEQVRAAVKRLTTSPADTRARAVLLISWIVGQRRSDIAALRVRDITFVKEGFEILLPKSKTDPLGEGRTLGVTRRGGRFCAVDALEKWLAIRKPSGPDDLLLDVSAATVNLIVKQAAASLGLDAKKYGGHSLRRGFVTSAYRAGKDTASIMAVTGHKDLKQMLVYLEKATPFKRDIGSALLADEDETAYASVMEDESSKAPVIAVVESDGQTLVDRKAARRIVRAPGFTKEGGPCDVEWLALQSKRLYARGRSIRAIVAALNSVDIRCGGKELTEEDVRRLVARADE